VNSTAMMLRTKRVNEAMNPRYADLRDLYERLGADGRELFFKLIATIAEFAVFSALDFVEHYNRFESETNDDNFPRLDFVYHPNEREEQAISKFGSGDLGILFKGIARRNELRDLVDAAIRSNLRIPT